MPSLSWVLSLALLVAGSRVWARSPSLTLPPTEITSNRLDFIFAPGLFPASHTSTLVETSNGLFAAWVSGPAARHPEAAIYTARFDGTRWSTPVKSLSGEVRGTNQFQTWNPVLFQPANGPLLFFFKIGPNPEGWWGMVTTSTNQGETWSTPSRLPPGHVGPVRNKPIELSDGSLLCGASTENDGWKVHLERLSPSGHWQKIGPLPGLPSLSAIQPTFLAHSARRLQILCRTKEGRLAESWSTNAGASWTPLRLTDIPNPNSAVDAVRLTNGEFILAYNHSPTNRGELNLALSKDGLKWTPLMVVEKGEGEFSYPAIIQTRSGEVHLTYSWNRKGIKHAIINLKKTSRTNSR